ncbi:hypothetical protein C8E87_2034 [Paractinoplanes brasiliensis]|uniref:Uncharacterized protein n=1 Tax=Paractinoplanes brasiliensis TaxID=52695 RepID=A0A4R6JSI8_9ACTN|nr:hypothetical protein C8E87_2034 [Actinoplanes brasiliensis]
MSTGGLMALVDRLSGEDGRTHSAEGTPGAGAVVRFSLTGQEPV